MSGEKWTAGPWRVGDAGTAVFGPKRDDGSLPQTVAVVSRAALATDENRANARLIAAAPDMAEALKECAARLEMAASDANGRGDQEDAAGFARIATRARAALAKARGER